MEFYFQVPIQFSSRNVSLVSLQAERYGKSEFLPLDYSRNLRVSQGLRTEEVAVVPNPECDFLGNVFILWVFQVLSKRIELSNCYPNREISSSREQHASLSMMPRSFSYHLFSFFVPQDR